MKLFYSIIATLLITINSLTAQNYQTGKITTTNNEILNGKIFLDNNLKNILLKKNNNASQTYSFDSVSSVFINGREFSKINFKNNTFFAVLLENGKASLYDLSNSDYLIIKENGEGKFINFKEDKSQLPGILSLLFNDCNEIRSKINNSETYSEKTLINLTNNYNNCNYGEYSPTQKELESANSYNTDTFHYYFGIQTSFNNLSVNNVSKSSQSFGLGLGISSSPSFLRKVQGNIYFDFDISLLFSGESEFKNFSPNLSFNMNSYRFSLGAKYLFNKKGSIKPFLGIGYGYTMDYYKGDYGTVAFKDNKQNYFFIPKVGALFQLSNGNHLGFTLSYISEYENNLSFIVNDFFYPFIVKHDFYVIGLSYNL